MALKTRAREVEDDDEIEELESDSDTEIDPAGDEAEEEEDEEQEEKPKAKSSKVKVKPKTKRVVEEDEDEDEDERPAAKKKSRAVAEDEEEEEVPRKKVKASGKKILKMKKPTGKKRAVVHRWARHGWKIPYDKDSMVGKVFLKALEGAKVITLKRMITELRETKKGGSWVLSDLRKGAFNGATWTWNEKNGFAKITNLKMAA